MLSDSIHIGRKLLAIVLIAIPAVSFAGTYPASHTGSLELGSGYFPEANQLAPRRCFVSGSVTGGPTQPKTFHHQFAESHEELERAASSNLSLRAKYGPMSLAAGIDTLNEIRMDSRKLVFAIRTYEDFGSKSYRFSGSGLNATGELERAEAWQAPESDRVKIFQSRCGEEYVIKVVNIVEIAALLIFESSSKEEKSSLKTALSLAYGGVGASGKVDAATAQEWKKVVNKTKAELNFKASGGPPLSVFSKLPKEPSNVEAILDGLSKYLSRATTDNAVAYSYQTRSTKDFLPRAKGGPIPSVTELVYKNLFTKFLKAEDGLDESRRILDEWGIWARFVASPETARNLVEDQKKTYESLQEELALAAEDCRLFQIAKLQGDSPTTECKDLAKDVKAFTAPEVSSPFHLVCGHVQVDADRSVWDRDRKVHVRAKLAGVAEGDIVEAYWIDANGVRTPLVVSRVGDQLPLKYETGYAYDQKGWLGAHQIRLVDGIGRETTVVLGRFYNKSGHNQSVEVKPRYRGEKPTDQNDIACGL